MALFGFIGYCSKVADTLEIDETELFEAARSQFGDIQVNRKNI